MRCPVVPPATSVVPIPPQRVPRWRSPLSSQTPRCQHTYTWKWGRNLIPSLNNTQVGVPVQLNKHFLGVIFHFVWADLKAFLRQEVSGLGFHCLLVQIVAILIEPLAKIKLNVTLSSVLWVFSFAPAALSALSETRAKEGAAVNLLWDTAERNIICNRVPTLYLFKPQSIYGIYIVSQLGWEPGVQECGSTPYLQG